MSTRNSDKRLLVLPETPGEEHCEITGAKLPTFKQVLFCFMVYFDKAKSEQPPNPRPKRFASKIVQEKVVYHYQKAGIEHISCMKMC